jgi:predicted MFS family arabinose efflux permease
MGSWMHDVAAGWFMTTLNPSPAMVALVQAASTLPVFLLALPAGTLADRMDKRQLLLAVQTTMLLIAATLGGLVLAGVAGEITLLIATFGLGMCMAIMSPTWQSIIPKLVPKDTLQPAIALHAVGMNISRAIGPAVGGAIIVTAGIAWPFLINALTFVAVIIALLYWHAPVEAPKPGPREAFMTALRAGLQHAAENKPLQNTLWRSVLFFAFGSCYWALLPLIAREQLSGGASLFGVLVACIGAGAVAGAILLPRVRVTWGLDRVLVAGTLGTALALTGYALFRHPFLGMLASLIAGASWIASLSSLNVAAQLAVPDWVRARGMAMYTSVFYGCLALGSILWGQIATFVGITNTLLVAAIGAVIGIAAGRRLPLRKPLLASP